MPDGREKYQAYLCGREWSVLKEAVRKRSGGVCERCLANEMDHVHHLTYERKYRERMDDLQAICKPCHDFIHAKSERDPRVDSPVFVSEPTGDFFSIRSVYLAGKITQDNWRDEIIDNWSSERDCMASRKVVDSCGWEWGVVKNLIPAGHGSMLDYCGPWWSDMGQGGGHGESNQCGFPHAYGGELQWAHGEPLDLCDPDSLDTKERQGIVARQVLQAVKKCDLLFAWINTDDCFGTIFEIGLAQGFGKCIVVASPPEYDDANTWLARQFATLAISAETPRKAWQSLVAHMEED